MVTEVKPFAVKYPVMDDTVEFLEDMLEKAKSGKMKTIALCCTFSGDDGAIRHTSHRDHAGLNYNDSLAFVGLVRETSVMVENGHFNNFRFLWESDVDG